MNSLYLNFILNEAADAGCWNTGCKHVFVSSCRDLKDWPILFAKYDTNFFKIRSICFV